jgi:hypothetical protein
VTGNRNPLLSYYPFSLIYLGSSQQVLKSAELGHEKDPFAGLGLFPLAPYFKNTLAISTYSFIIGIHPIGSLIFFGLADSLLN